MPNVKDTKLQIYRLDGMFEESFLQSVYLML